MSQLAISPPHNPADPRPHGEYDYNPMRTMRQRMALYCGKNRGRYTAITEALRALGQYCVDEKLEGRMSYNEAREVLGRDVHRTTYTRQMFWLTDCGVLIEEDDGRYFRIRDYARKNRTIEQWREVQQERRTFWRQSKRAQRQNNRSKHSAPRTIKAALEVSEMPNSAFVPASYIPPSKTPPTPTPALVSNGGVGEIKNQTPSTPPPKPAEQAPRPAERLSKIDPVGALSGLFAKAEPPSEAHLVKLRQVFDAAPEPAPGPAPAAAPDAFEADPWVLKMRAKSLARHGRAVDEAYAQEQLTPKSRPETLKFERVPITETELDAIAQVPEPKRSELLRGGHTRAEVRRAYEAACQDPTCRSPERVLLSRLQRKGR